MTTIQSHYNSLRRKLQLAEHVLNSLSDLPGVDLGADRTLTAEIYRALNEQAERQFPIECAELAASRSVLPLLRLRFGDSGYRIANSLCFSGESHRPGEEMRIWQAALPLLQHIVATEAHARRKAFDAYARAVEQGVAVPPPDCVTTV